MDFGTQQIAGSQSMRNPDDPETAEIKKLSNAISLGMILEQFTGLLATVFMVTLMILVRVAIFGESGQAVSFGAVMEDAQMTSDWLINLLNCFVYFSYMFLTFMLICAILKKNPLKTIPLQRPSNTKRIPAFAAVGLCFMLAGEYYANYFQYILSKVHLKVDLPQFTFPNNTPALIFYVMQICVLAPLCEEFLFRGLILQNLRRFGNLFAVLATSAIFGLIHANLMQTPFAFVVGIALALLAIETGSIWPGVALHALVNTISVLTDGLTYYFGSGVSSTVYGLLMLAFIAFGILSAVWLFRSGYVKTAAAKYRGKAGRVPYAAGAFVKSPACIIFILFFSFLMLTTLTRIQ